MSFVVPEPIAELFARTVIPWANVKVPAVRPALLAASTSVPVPCFVKLPVPVMAPWVKEGGLPRPNVTVVLGLTVRVVFPAAPVDAVTAPRNCIALPASVTVPHDASVTLGAGFSGRTGSDRLGPSGRETTSMERIAEL